MKKAVAALEEHGYGHTADRAHAPEITSRSELLSGAHEMRVSPGQKYRSRDPRDLGRTITVTGTAKGKRELMIVAVDDRTGATIKVPELLLTGALWELMNG